MIEFRNARRSSAATASAEGVNSTAAPGSHERTDTCRPSADDDASDSSGSCSTHSATASDVPSASTVLPPLFDDRINLSKTSVGRDHGQFADPKVTKAMDKATQERDRKDRAKQWAQIDTGLLEDGVYIPLRQTRLTYAAGSEVTSLIGNSVYGGVPEIGVLGVSE